MEGRSGIVGHNIVDVKVALHNSRGRPCMVGPAAKQLLKRVLAFLLLLAAGIFLSFIASYTRLETLYLPPQQAKNIVILLASILLLASYTSKASHLDHLIALTIVTLSFTSLTLGEALIAIAATIISYLARYIHKEARLTSTVVSLILLLILLLVQ